MLIILEISIEGNEAKKILPNTSSLIVSNHISYLDIIVLASKIPGVFVAKSDVARWTLLGWLAKLGGTIFVDRTALRSGIVTAGKISAALQKGVNVVVFPEGTSSNGEKVLPFKPSIFFAALESNASILPVTIQYASIDGKRISEENRDVVSWYGSMEFAGHFWEVLRRKNIRVQVLIHDAIGCSEADSVHTLAAMSQKLVASALNQKQIILQQIPVS